MLVKDAVTKAVYTATPEIRVDEIAHLFFDHHISGVPVVDGGGVIGLGSRPQNLS